MKFSSVLGIFALATLEAYRAYASPLEAVSPGARSLEGRAADSCCLQVDGQTTSLPYSAKGGDYDNVGITTSELCTISLRIGTTAPSQAGCKSWPLTVTCPDGVKGTKAKYSVSAC
ncbi:hypothetical protein E4U56_001587 [Claviceps arundinis]|uniref:Uncharacterized protein n=1 Tax=Claviceps arundinis TaxID=1623583 RepID=A0A9P7MS98_9HYPO|nr:hypothetical protein E4U56_001587 [Claviceps arundinis]